MKKEIKKGVLTLGAITAIVTPIAAVISCGVQNTLNYDGSKDKIGDQNLDDFFDSLQSLGLKDRDALSKGEYQASFYLYDKEQEGSIKMQKADLAFQLWKANIVYEKSKGPEGKYKDKGFAADSKETIDKNKDDLDKVQALYNKIKGDKLDDGEYDSSTFAADFPLVLKPKSKITTEQEKIYDEARSNFISKYSTQSEGEANWPEERRTKYNSAKSKDEAVEYLANQVISNDSIAQYKFEVNKSHTVLENLWSKYASGAFLTNDKTEKYNGATYLWNDKKVYHNTSDADLENLYADASDMDKLVDKYVEDDSTTQRLLSDTVVFLGTKSKITDKVMRDIPPEYIKNIINVKHALLEFKQGKTPEEAWDVSAEQLEKLFNFYNDGGTWKTGYDLITDVDTLFKEPPVGATPELKKQIQEHTKSVLTEVTKADGTVDVGGSLGYKSVLEYVKSMVPGFAFGILDEQNDLDNLRHDADLYTRGTPATPGTPGTPATDPSGLFAVIGKEIAKQATDEGFTLADPTTIDTQEKAADYRKALKQLFEKIGADKVKAIFGAIIRDHFTDKDRNGEMYYDMKDASGNIIKGVGVVKSSFGIHIIKITTPNDINVAIGNDMQSLANKEYDTSKTGIADLINAHNTIINIMKELVDGDKDFKTFIDKVDSVKFDDIKEALDKAEAAEPLKKVTEAIGDKISSYYIAGKDSGLLTTDVKPTEIYDALKKGV